MTNQDEWTDDETRPPGFQAFLGRVLFSAVFLAAGFNKAQDLWLHGGVQTLQYMKPKLDAFAIQMAGFTGTVAPLKTLGAYHWHLLLVACIMEVLGPLLFVLGSATGAKIMVIFLLGVTPIMHNFWATQGMESMIETIMFMKVSTTETRTASDGRPIFPLDSEGCATDGVLTYLRIASGRMLPCWEPW